MTKKSYSNSDSTFIVYKIDSINSYYLIYAERRGEKFKIVSKKQQNSKCKRVSVNESYVLSLESLWTTPIMIGDVDVSPSIIPHVTCLGFDDSTTICIDRDNRIYDLFRTRNIKGLCFLD